MKKPKPQYVVVTVNDTMTELDIAVERVPGLKSNYRVWVQMDDVDGKFWELTTEHTGLASAMSAVADIIQANVDSELYDMAEEA